MPSPIPIYCRDNAGTGFLVTDETRVWLATCVHLVSGMRETPLIDSIFTTAQLGVAGTAAALPLFIDKRQRFSVVRNETTGKLVDAIAIRLEPREIGGLISYGMFNVGSIVRGRLGDEVTVSGFPSLGSSINAGETSFKHSEVRYEIDRIEGLSIRFSGPSAVGLSGGPVTHEDGLLGIMYGDVGMSTSMINGLAVSLDVIGSHLFV